MCQFHIPPFGLSEGHHVPMQLSHSVAFATLFREPLPLEGAMPAFFGFHLVTFFRVVALQVVSSDCVGEALGLCGVNSGNMLRLGDNGENILISHRLNKDDAAGTSRCARNSS